MLADSYCAVTLIPEISYTVYQVNVTIIRNIKNHYHHFPNNWTRANFSSMDAFGLVPSVKNFQESQLAQLLYTTQHRTVLIVFPLTLWTITIAQALCTRGEDEAQLLK